MLHDEEPKPAIELMVDLDDAEGGSCSDSDALARQRRFRTPRLRQDGLAVVAAGAVRLESARRGLSQKDLALELGLSRTAVSARFRGHAPWTLDEIGRLAQLFDCRVVELVSEAPDIRGRTVW
ncbi:helix-turn-helix domain-containing protein [Isoptericola jiangsuensis]|uniref:helix-turn-helix domain-containing protein n=1 Tax=Isoptericola jiangsuensis TaxID=548579 RepID=UPI003AAF6157